MYTWLAKCLRVLIPHKGRLSIRLSDVKTVLEAAERGLTGIGMPGVEPIARIPLLIIQYYEAVKADAHAMDDLASSLVTLHTIILGPVEEARAQGPARIPDGLSRRIDTIQNAISDSRDQLAPFASLTAFQRFRRRDEISSALNEVNRRISIAIRDFQVEGQITTEMLLGSLRTHFNLSLLRLAEGSSWDPERTCLSGTRIDILKQLKQFVTAPHGDSPVRIELIVGVLGCGKSTIAHSLSRFCHTEDPRLLGGSFFFSREVDSRERPDLLASTIAYSLGGLHPDFATAISATIEADRSILSAPFARQFRALLLEPIKNVSQSQRLTHPIAFVIDALDEGFSEGLLDILARDCAELPSNCRMVIISRPEQRIMQLRGLSHIDVREVLLDDQHNLEDVARFSRAALTDIARTEGLTDWPKDAEVQAFIGKSEGLFIWVAVVSAFLRRCTNPKRQFERIIKDQRLFSLDSDAKMRDMYRTVLSACPWDDEDFASKYKDLMGTIIALRTPLSPHAIETLLMADFSVVKTLRPLSPVLAGILSVELNQPIHILHQSFREFSTHPDVEQQYRVDPQEHSNHLALYALLALNRGIPLLKTTLEKITRVLVHVDAEDMHIGMPASSRYTLPTPPANTISEVLWYSSRFVIHHLTGVTQPSAELVSALREFLETNLSSWIIICACGGSYQGISQLLSCSTAQAISPVDSVSLNKAPIADQLLRLSNHLFAMGRWQEAFDANHDSVELYRRLATCDPLVYNAELAKSLNSFSHHLRYIDRPEAALDAAREGTARLRTLPSDGPDARTARSLNNLSSQLMAFGPRHFDEALATSDEATRIFESLASGRPDADYAKSLGIYSNRLASLGKIEEAIEVGRRGATMYRSLAAEQPESDTFQRDLARSLAGLSHSLFSGGNYPESRQMAEEASSILRSLAHSDPQTYNPELAISLNNLSDCLSALHEAEAALKVSEECVVILRSLSHDRPVPYSHGLARSLLSLSHRLRAVGRLDESASAAREGSSLYRSFAVTRPGSFKLALAEALACLSEILQSLSLFEEALETAQEGTALCRALASEQPSAFNHHLAGSLNNLSCRLMGSGRHQEALESMQEGIAIFRATMPRHANPMDLTLFPSLTNLASIFCSMDRHEEALNVALERVALTSSTPHFNLYTNSLRDLVVCQLNLRHRQEALEASREAIARIRAHAPHQPPPNPRLAKALHTLVFVLTSGSTLEDAARTLSTEEVEEAKQAIREFHEVYDDSHDELCGSCRTKIYGPRYHCKTCPDFDLCNGCFTEKRGMHTLEHEFSCFRTRLDAPLAAIRLMSDLDAP